MIDTLIFLFFCLPLVCTIVWYIIEKQETDLHKQEMAELWDLYAEESMLPGNGEPLKGIDTDACHQRPTPSWSALTKSRWKLYRQRNNL